MSNNGCRSPNRNCLMTHLSFQSFNTATEDAFISLFCCFSLFFFASFILPIVHCWNEHGCSADAVFHRLSLQGRQMKLHVGLHGDLGLGPVPAVWPAYKTLCPDELFSSAESKKLTATGSWWVTEESSKVTSVGLYQRARGFSPESRGSSLLFPFLRLFVLFIIVHVGFLHFVNVYEQKIRE